MVMLAFKTLANIYVSKCLLGGDKCALVVVGHRCFSDLVLVGQHALLLYICTNDPESIYI